MRVFIGLDVSLAKTAICVVDRDGAGSGQSHNYASAFQVPALMVPVLRPVSIKGIQAALRAARTLP
jgi:hypothetical protein